MCYLRYTLSLFRRQFGGGPNSSKSSPKKGYNKGPSGKSASSSASQPATSLDNCEAIEQQEELYQLTSGLQNTSFATTPPIYLSPRYAEQSILAGDISKFVRLPTYQTREEWISSHVFEFFHLINAFYESISEVCTSKNCGLVLLTSEAPLVWNTEFLSLLSDGMSITSIASSGYNPQRNSGLQSAAMFIDYALTWIDQQLEDPQKFPVRLDGTIREDFEKLIARPIFILLYIILCHIYEQHFQIVDLLGQVAHLNALFAHFIAFTTEFSLLSPLDTKRMDPLSRVLLRVNNQVHELDNHHPP